MDTSKKRLEQYKEDSFPNLYQNGYEVTSEETSEYNCIAWAAGEENNQAWWTPIAMGNGYYWPEEIPKKLDVASFIKLYEFRGGYTPCDNGELESGFEKLAIYVDSNSEVTHAARQQQDGTWTSKLGAWEDIGHNSVEGLYGDCYGTVAQFLKRPINRK